MSRVAAASAWAMGEWSMMEEYSRCIPRDTNEGAFYRAVLAVHKDQHHMAQQVGVGVGEGEEGRQTKRLGLLSLTFIGTTSKPRDPICFLSLVIFVVYRHSNVSCSHQTHY